MGGVDYVTQFKTAESFRWHGTYLSTFKLLTTTYILHFFSSWLLCSGQKVN